MCVYNYLKNKKGLRMFLKCLNNNSNILFLNINEFNGTWKIEDRRGVSEFGVIKLRLDKEVVENILQELK